MNVYVKLVETDFYLISVEDPKTGRLELNIPCSGENKERNAEEASFAEKILLEHMDVIGKTIWKYRSSTRRLARVERNA